MKKKTLYTALMAIVCISAQADDLNKPITPPPAATPATSTSTTTTTSSTTTAAAPATPELNCQYRIPATTTKVEQSLISTWSEKATVQAFEFDPENVDQQLETLKPCFTDQGWQGFNDALVKSGNVNSIKTQKLTVSSQVDGTVQINQIKDNQWKVTVPMQVVYQNDKEKLTQLLSVDLLVGRKISGDLGIMQMIATPRIQEAPVAAAAPAAPTVATPEAQASTTTTTTTQQTTTSTPEPTTTKP